MVHWVLGLLLNFLLSVYHVLATLSLKFQQFILLLGDTCHKNGLYHLREPNLFFEWSLPLSELDEKYGKSDAFQTTVWSKRNFSWCGRDARRIHSYMSQE